MMAVADNSSRQSLIPSFLYSPSISSKRLFDFDVPVNTNHGLYHSMFNISKPSSSNNQSRTFMIPAPNEKIEMFSPAYYAACTAGGIFSCGLTHMTVTPLDLVKCNMQVPDFIPLRLTCLNAWGSVLKILKYFRISKVLHGRLSSFKKFSLLNYINDF